MQVHRVLEGLPRMDHHGQTPLRGQGQLGREGFPLGLPRGEVVVVVEADLAHRRGGRLLKRSREVGRTRTLPPRRLMGMEARRGPAVRAPAPGRRTPPNPRGGSPPPPAGLPPRASARSATSVRSASKASMARWQWESVHGTGGEWRFGMVGSGGDSLMSDPSSFHPLQEPPKVRPEPRRLEWRPCNRHVRNPRRSRPCGFPA